MRVQMQSGKINSVFQCSFDVFAESLTCFFVTAFNIWRLWCDIWLLLFLSKKIRFLFVQWNAKKYALNQLFDQTTTMDSCGNECRLVPNVCFFKQLLGLTLVLTSACKWCAMQVAVYCQQLLPWTETFWWLVEWTQFDEGSMMDCCHLWQIESWHHNWWWVLWNVFWI